MAECWIGLGANQGDARHTFDEAWARLVAHPQVTSQRRSGLYRTAPVGRVAGDEFVNAVGGISTTLTPLELLDLLQVIEVDLGAFDEFIGGRARSISTCCFGGDLLIREPRLVVPHPAAWHRRFVVDPLAEAAPTLRHPEWNVTISELRSGLLARPLTIRLPSGSPSETEWLQSEIAPRFSGVRWVREESLADVPLVELPVGRAAESQADLRLIPVPSLTLIGPESTQAWIDFLTATLDEPERFADW